MISPDMVDDYLIVDGLITVEFRQNGTGLTRTILNVERSSIDEMEAALSNGVFTTRDLRFQISKAELDLEPKVSDEIVVGDDIYTAISVTERDLDELWDVIGKNFRLAANLHDTVTIEEQVQAIDPETGTIGTTWEAVPAYIDLPARIQPLSARDVEEFGAREIEVDYAGYFDRDLDVDERHRVRRGGEIFYIREWRGKEDIGSLFTLFLKKSVFQ